ncbi:MAG: hypothetical protein IIB68_08735 [Proteobacteria bacterium]|nr:hypothetical protein [Pseudomonadota bacterium]
MAMMLFFALVVTLEGVSPGHAGALAAIFAEHRRENSGEPYVRAKAISDLNDDGIVDAVIVFAYKMGPSRNHTHTEYLSIVMSTPSGYVASWPIIVGSRGFRHIREIEIVGTEITLRGDFTVSDETASMATLPANGEIHFSFVDGKLREQGGYWTRKPDQ